MDLRFLIQITDRVTGLTVVKRSCDSFSFVVRHRRNKDLPTHEIVADEFDRIDETFDDKDSLVVKGDNLSGSGWSGKEI